MIMSCTDLDFLPASNPHRIESSGWDDYSVPAGSTDEGDYPLASPGRIRVVVASRWRGFQLETCFIPVFAQCLVGGVKLESLTAT
jgi:hypothetical protein